MKDIVLYMISKDRKNNPTKRINDVLHWKRKKELDNLGLDCTKPVFLKFYASE